MSFDGLLDTAFEQIRHYAVADIAVSLRLMRAFNDIASVTQRPDLRTTLLERARRVVTGCGGRLTQDELVKLQQRLAALETIIAAECRMSECLSERFPVVRGPNDHGMA
jgi:uncharacterized membrane protein